MTGRARGSASRPRSPPAAPRRSPAPPTGPGCCRGTRTRPGPATRPRARRPVRGRRAARTRGTGAPDRPQPRCRRRHHGVRSVANRVLPPGPAPAGVAGGTGGCRARLHDGSHRDGRRGGRSTSHLVPPPSLGRFPRVAAGVAWLRALRQSDLWCGTLGSMAGAAAAEAFADRDWGVAYPPLVPDPARRPHPRRPRPARSCRLLDR